MLIARWIFIILGLTLLGPLVFVLQHKLTFWYTAQEATATVVDFEMGSSSGRNRNRGPALMYPMVCFVTAQGDSIRVNGLTGTNPPMYRLGERLQLRYDPANPNQVEMPDFFSQWGGILVTSLFAGLGILSLRAGLESKRHNKKMV